MADTQRNVIDILMHDHREVYPLIRERISKQQAQRSLQEHAEAEITMKRLGSLQPGEPTFDKQLALLMKEVREQVAEEECQLFPQLRSAFTVEELLELGAK